MRDRLCRAVTDTAFTATGILGLALIFLILGFLDDRMAMLWMVSSFGASLTLLLACPDSPLSKPYPALVGNVGSAGIGVASWTLLGDHMLAAVCLAVVGAIGMMSLLRAWHPPGGASAMLAVVGGPTIHKLGWWYPLCPIFIGTAWLLFLAHWRSRARLEAYLKRNT